MPKITKKIRRGAIELLSACACEVAHHGQLLYMAQISETLFDGSDFDLYEQDLVMQVASAVWMASEYFSPGDHGYPQNHVEKYIEAEYKLRDGFTPDLED